MEAAFVAGYQGGRGGGSGNYWVMSEVKDQQLEGCQYDSEGV